MLQARILRGDDLAVEVLELYALVTLVADALDGGLDPVLDEGGLDPVRDEGLDPDDDDLVASRIVPN